MENVETNGRTAASIVGLYKKYSKNGDYAVKNLNLTLPKGEIVGLIGANGAGKSTTLKCLTGMLAPTQGEISVCGYSLKRQPIEAKRQFSFVSDNHSVFEKMTGAEYLSFMADIYKVSTAGRQEIIDGLLKCFNLNEKLNVPISGYSHGTKQKICMIGSLIHMPKLWILDEPMLGLDPVTIESVCEFMKAYKKQGNTIIFSSHNLDTVGKLCDRVVVINKGEKTGDIYLDGDARDNAAEVLCSYYLNNNREKSETFGGAPIG